MTSPWQYALTVGPLGFYLWVLALWQSDRHPRVVRGLVDFGMLAFGIGGVLAFGPFGQLLARMISPRPGLPSRGDRVVVLCGSVHACTSVGRDRLVVYHVDPECLIPALADVLRQNRLRFVKTMAGFEDVTSTRRGLRVEFTRWLRCATVEAHGLDAEALIREIAPAPGAPVPGRDDAPVGDRPEPLHRLASGDARPADRPLPHPAPRPGHASGLAGAAQGGEDLNGGATGG